MPFKKSLRSEQVMSSVDLAARYVDRMIDREGGAGTEEAMRRIESRTGIGYWTLWALRYKRRTLKEVAVDQFERIRSAYIATCERQIKALQHEVAVEKARCPDDDLQDLVDAAEALAARIQAAKDARLNGALTPKVTP